MHLPVISDPTDINVILSVQYLGKKSMKHFDSQGHVFTFFHMKFSWVPHPSAWGNRLKNDRDQDIGLMELIVGQLCGFVDVETKSTAMIVIIMLINKHNAQQRNWSWTKILHPVTSSDLTMDDVITKVFSFYGDELVCSEFSDNISRCSSIQPSIRKSVSA